MNSTSQRRLSVCFAAATVALLGVATLSTPAVSQVTYSTPVAPASVNASLATGGFHVQWAATQANPEVSHYIITSGAGSCPVIVGASTRTAFLPALNTASATITVQAVNEYGISAPKAIEAAIAATSVSKDHKSVQLLQLSDFHGQLEPSSSFFGAALLASNFEAERKVVPATFTVSSGDNIGAAPPISSQFAELPTIEVMNAMGVDVSNFGNHEHDRNIAHLRSMIAAADFQWVSSNYSSLAGLNAGDGKRARSFLVTEREGVKVGFIGINTTQTIEQIMPGNLDFTVQDPNNPGKELTQTIQISNNMTQIRGSVAMARAAGAEVVVALIHEGWNNNADGKAQGPLIDFAKSLTGVDVVYGAHSHLTYSSVYGGRMTAMVRNAGVEYNRTQVCVNTKTKRVVGSSNEVITRANARVTTGGQTLAAGIVAGYKTQLNAKLDVKVGRVNMVSPIGGTPPIQRSQEHVFGNWSADVVRAKYGTDFALVNGGGIRSSFPASNYAPGDTSIIRPKATDVNGPWDIVLGDVYTIQPFGNVFSTIEVTGAQLWAAMENGVSRYPSDGRWPHVSGLKFTADVTKPAGSRIVALTNTAGTAIPKDGTTFSLALTDFVAKGGDGYNMFNISKLSVRDLDADVLIEALKADAAAGRVTQFKLDGRTTVIK